MATALAMVIDNEADMTCAGTATTIAEARRHIAEQPPDVILMDVHLADGNGLEATAALKSDGLTSAVLILTSAAEPEVLRRAEEAGASGVLAKGDGFSLIVDQIRTAGRGGVAPAPS